MSNKFFYGVLLVCLLVMLVFVVLLIGAYADSCYQVFFVDILDYVNTVLGGK